MLILRKVTKIVATRCHINAPNSILAGTLPHTPLEELKALAQTLWLDLRGPTSKGREEGREERAGQAREAK